MDFFVLAYAISLSDFSHIVFNNCTKYKQEIAFQRMNEAVTAQERLGAICKKTPEMYSYSCSYKNKLIVVELHKIQKSCTEAPSKTVSQLKFMMK
jgi:hypothetical protein